MKFENSFNYHNFDKDNLVTLLDSLEDNKGIEDKELLLTLMAFRRKCAMECYGAARELLELTSTILHLKPDLKVKEEFFMVMISPIVMVGCNSTRDYFRWVDSVRTDERKSFNSYSGHWLDNNLKLEDETLTTIISYLDEHLPDFDIDKYLENKVSSMS